MNEDIALFGPDNRLSGIVSSTDVTTSGIGVIFLNAGVIHRVGPGRLYVKIARALAQHNITAMRLDLSGLGETPSAPAGKDYITQAHEDVGMAISYMQETIGIKTIYLSGICSGADHAYEIAKKNKAVGGVILLDPYAYRSGPGHRRYLLKRALQPERWGGVLRRIWASVNLACGGDRQRCKRQNTLNARIVPARKEFGQGLQELTRRGVVVCIFYTRSVQHMVSTPKDFFDIFKNFEFRQIINLQVDPTSDHTFTTLAAQTKVTQTIVDWMVTAR